MEAPMTTERTNEVRFDAQNGTRAVSVERKRHGMEHRWGPRISCHASMRIRIVVKR